MFIDLEIWKFRSYLEVLFFKEFFQMPSYIWVKVTTVGKGGPGRG